MSYLRVQKSGIFTPQLKRNLDQHQSQRTASKLTPNLLIQSRQRKVSSFQISPSMVSAQNKQDSVETKDESIQNKSSLLNQQQEEALQQIVQINEVFKQLIGGDLKLANKRKERKAYNHSYQQQTSYGQIWVDEPKEIPKQVFQESQIIAAKKGNQKINCLRGFIDELAIFYYSIENIVLFYDAETIGRDSFYLSMIQLEEKSLSALYGIQIFRLGKPYFESKKNVMVFLHPYEAEMYEFDLKNNLQQNKRELKIKPLLSFPLPQQIPSHLYHSSKGYLYCTDDKGKIYKIDCNQHFWNLDKKQLKTKKLRGSALVVLKNSTKYLAISLRAFAQHIKNYTLSFWRSKLARTWLLFDEDKEIMVTLIKEQNRQQRKNRFLHKFLVYNQKSNELYYTFQLEQSTIKNDEIMVFVKLYTDCNTKYNFMVLMQSGKRVLLDIQSDRLRKTSIIKPPPLNTNESYTMSKSNNLISCCLQQDLMAQVVFTNHHYLILTQQVDYQTETVNYLQIEPNQASNIYVRQNQPFGYRKGKIVQSEQTNLKPQNLPEFSRQIFYKPYQLYYSTDEIVQKIIVLRPIDIFYSLFVILSEKIPQFFKALSKLLPQVDSINLISFCCQLFVDSQGIYLISRELQYKAYSGWENKSKVDWQMIEYVRFKDIHSSEKMKLIQIMVDIAIQAGYTQRQDKQRYIVKGILSYYAKLFKPIFLANINVLTSELCKITIYSLRQLHNLALHLDKYFKGEGKSYLSKLFKWISRFQQFITFIKNIPNLPNMSLDECITQKGDKFHEYLFKFLVRQCKEQIFDQIKKMFTIFVTSKFTRIYKLYCQVSTLKDATKILQKCKIYDKLPSYFVDYLVKVKNIPEAVLLKEADLSQIKQLTQTKPTYFTKMNEFYSTRTNLYEKQQILFNASTLLRQQGKQSKIDIKQQQEKIKRLMGQLKLQQLIIECYHNRLINKSLWIKIISPYLSNTAVQSEQQAIIHRLDTCLLDHAFLENIIQHLQHPFLKVMYAYYFHPYQFQAVFFRMAEEIFNTSHQSISELNAAYRQELHFMICKAKLSFAFSQITIILDTFINLILKCEQLQSFLDNQAKFIEKDLFWPLSYCAEIGLDIDKLYSWGINKLSQSNKGDKSYTYLALCCTYLVKDFLPIKQSELASTLRCEQQNKVILKQIYSLLIC